MTLLTIISGASLNHKMIMYAAKKAPALIIDCANSADPHAFYPEISIEQFRKLYVIELELLYKFRDALLRVPSIMKNIGARTIVVTTSDHLFNYQDEKENYNIMDHSWELLKRIGEKYTVIAAVTPDSKHLRFARKYSHKLEVDKHRTHCIKPKADYRHDSLRVA